MMKWLLALLVVANGVLYFWQGEHADENAHLPPAQPEVNRESMLLADEARAVSEVLPVAQTSPTSTATCYRIGPFKKKFDWRAATRWMDARQLAYRTVRADDRETRTIEVYLGPYASRTAARPVTAWLADSGINHFVERRESGVHISLGYFMQESLAARFVAHLATQNITAKSREAYRDLARLTWLETRADSSAADLRARLLEHKWRGKKVTVVTIVCGG